MLMIAALVGTKDLGQEVLIALNRSLVGEGIVAGLCVACLALIADGLLKAAAARAGSPSKEGQPEIDNTREAACEGSTCHPLPQHLEGVWSDRC